MKVLIVYDTVYGNTESLARAMAAAVGPDARVMRAGEADPSALAGLDLLVLGFPTHGGRPMPSVQAFLDRLPALQGVRVAVFDTRSPGRFARIFGDAADRAAATLKERGATVVGEPGGFYVEGKKGPVKAGEEERAVAWVRAVLERM